MVTLTKQFDRFGRAAMNQGCLCSGPRPASPALLSANSRRGNFFPDASPRQLESHLSQGGLLGSDGASLERSMDAFVDPISYRGGMNLYEYVGDNPLTNTDPSGLQIRGPMGMTRPDPGPSGPLPAPPADQITLPIQFSYATDSYPFDWTARWGMENDLVKANEIWAQCHIAFTNTEATPKYKKVGRSDKINLHTTMEDKYSPSLLGFMSDDNRRMSIYVTYIGGFKPEIRTGTNWFGDPMSEVTVTYGRTLPDDARGSASENILLVSSAATNILAHEIGHVLWGPMDDPDPANLMHHPQTGEKIPPCECENARVRAKALLAKWKRNGGR